MITFTDPALRAAVNRQAGKIAAGKYATETELKAAITAAARLALEDAAAQWKSTDGTR